MTEPANGGGPAAIAPRALVVEFDVLEPASVPWRWNCERCDVVLGDWLELEVDGVIVGPDYLGVVVNHFAAAHNTELMNERGFPHE